jgi:5-methyltetrahydrofolate--homocysteine methyltransferase
MGTQIQCLNLDEKNFRGDRFHSCDRLLQGNNDLLTLTQPQAIEDIHLAYALAGADILETNTFSSTSIAQADYGMEDQVYELNRDGARLAHRAAIKAEKADGRRRFVAGALGPTNRTASLSPDVNNPGFRAVSFDELRIAYGEQIKGLIDGGADILLIETIFDTLNAKAAIFACFEAFAERGFRANASDDLGHHHDSPGRTLPAPDADGVLAFGKMAHALFDRPQLRAWSQRNARASGRDLGRRRHARLRLPERRPAQRLRPI